MEPQSSPRRMENVAHPRRLDDEKISGPVPEITKNSPGTPNEARDATTAETKETENNEPQSSPRRMENAAHPSQLDDEEISKLKNSPRRMEIATHPNRLDDEKISGPVPEITKDSPETPNELRDATTADTKETENNEPQSSPRRMENVAHPIQYH